MGEPHLMVCAVEMLHMDCLFGSVHEFGSLEIAFGIYPGIEERFSVNVYLSQVRKADLSVTALFGRAILFLFFEGDLEAHQISGFKSHA